MKENIIIQKSKKQVIKICNSPKEFQKELYVYQKNFFFTPKLLDNDGKNTLILEYIHGIPIIDLAKPDFAKIAGIISKLHSSENKLGKCICHFDNNPKNYIFADDYYMLDFSLWRYDYPETDLIHFLLFWASIYKSNTFKTIFREFMDSYQQTSVINQIEWELLMPEVIERFDARRRKFGKKEINPDLINNRKILKNIF